jgi:hypothetical protein
MDSEVQHYDNSDQRYRADVRTGSATMAWSGSVGDFVSPSAPIDTSFSDYAQLGHDSTGSFY